MNVLFHYAAGPDLAARLAAVQGLRIAICAEDDGSGMGAPSKWNTITIT